MKNRVPFEVLLFIAAVMLGLSAGLMCLLSAWR